MLLISINTNMRGKRPSNPILVPRDGQAWEDWYWSESNQNTRKRYAYTLQSLAVMMKVMSYNELRDIGKDPKELERKMREILTVVIQKKRRWSTVSSYLKVAISFYKAQTELDAMPRWDRLWKLLGKPERRRQNDRAYTLEEIQAILKAAPTETWRAIILFLTCTAGRPGIIYDIGDPDRNVEDYYLKYDDLKVINHLKYGKMYIVTGYRGAEEEYFTFLTPECTKAIDDMTENRKLAGERITDESPVFRNNYKITSYRTGQWHYTERHLVGHRDSSIASVAGLTSRDKLKYFTREELEERRKFIIMNPKPLQATTICNEIQDIRKRIGMVTQKVGIDLGTWRNDVPVATGFRKFCISRMMDARIYEEKRKLMTDHSIGVEKHYAYVDLLEEYCKAIPLLTVSDEEREIIKRKLKEKELDETRTVLGEVLEDVEVKEKEIKKLDEQLRRWKERGKSGKA